MKKMEKAILTAAERVARVVVEQEKKGRSFCPTLLHQPKRPMRKSGK